MNKSMEIMAGGKITLKPEFTPVNTTNQKLDYTSSNTDVATVNSKGVVTTKKAGKTTITAKTKDGSKKTAKCKITVKGPKKTSLNKIDNSKKGTAILSWKEVKEADGYEIYMSTDKKKYNKIQTVKKSSTTTSTIKKLKSKTTYYFKVVTYVNVGKGKKAYGGESKVVKVTIK
ncbi:MAG: Ig-like domain-containing protein [Roseburia sp.]|nr:Ig-like domain-containing protein [Roseburia sp.]MCM1279816.1 Ig-like domain-containing protein [Robinsoniella sp.]